MEWNGMNVIMNGMEFIIGIIILKLSSINHFLQPGSTSLSLYRRHDALFIEKACFL